MSGVTSEDGGLPGSPDEQQYLYTVLNLPKTASDQEVRERYLQRSMLFHPDKHQDENTKETATKRFLEVQKAYEVLSDPVSRRAYDLLGPQGLRVIRRSDFVDIPEAEILLEKSHELRNERPDEITIKSESRILAGIDASSLFDDDVGYYSDQAPGRAQRLRNRFEDIRQTGLSFRHKIQRRLNDKTTLVLSDRMSVRPASARQGPFRIGLLGTVSHQFSPRLNFEATVSFLEASLLSTKTTFQDDDYTVTCQVHPSRALRWVSSGFVSQPGPVTLAYSRRLSSQSPMEGTVMFQTTSVGPAVAIVLSSAHLFDHTPEAGVPPAFLGGGPLVRPPSKSGLAMGSTYWEVQFSLASLLSGFNVEWGVVLAEIGLRLKTGLQLGLSGLNWTFGGEWRRGDSAIGSSVACNIEGVIFRLDIAYLGQALNLPIVLSHDREPGLALWTTAVPSAALALTYIFVLRPRHRRERLRFFRDARRALHEEKAELQRETKETVRLLQDIAKRHMDAESACDGLVILEAFYGPLDRDEAAEGLDLDVTVALQALVHRSQLYIPGRRSKAGLQGFYDPVPGVAKVLRIRYTFRGSVHYAEISDWMPVVLPLEEHLVD
ncbi:DnaJ-domain-containing protein [Daedalea quercina L-15889]|uniref:DnaJ-domain-containing protein n=1 Tax=Daedalea quercina L-15889 TaxID=1314783 RepID=A0A165R973_9APHY|nr:DnaJ-domain-containing protein [Daedalea quercina L-15889]